MALSCRRGGTLAHSVRTAKVTSAGYDESLVPPTHSKFRRTLRTCRDDAFGFHGPRRATAGLASRDLGGAGAPGGGADQLRLWASKQSRSPPASRAPGVYAPPVGSGASSTLGGRFAESWRHLPPRAATCRSAAAHAGRAAHRVLHSRGGVETPSKICRTWRAQAFRCEAVTLQAQKQ